MKQQAILFVATSLILTSISSVSLASQGNNPSKRHLPYTQYNNNSDDDDRSAQLIINIRLCDAARVKEDLETGTNPNSYQDTDDQGQVSALKVAIDSRYCSIEDAFHMVTFLIKHNAQVTPDLLMKTISRNRGPHGDTRLIALILKKAPPKSVDYQDENGWTSLIEAVMMQNLESIKMLHQAEANPSLETKKGLTALDLAVLNQDIPTVELLLELYHQQYSLEDLKKAHKRAEEGYSYQAQEATQKLKEILEKEILGKEISGKDKKPTEALL